MEWTKIDHIAKRLTHIKSAINDARDEESKAKGALEQLNKQLIAEFNCRTITEAEAELDLLNKKAKKLIKEINKEIEELEGVLDIQ